MTSTIKLPNKAGRHVGPMDHPGTQRPMKKWDNERGDSNKPKHTQSTDVSQACQEHTMGQGILLNKQCQGNWIFPFKVIRMDS